MANGKILLIDDDTALTKAVALSLKKEQMQTDIANDGETALKFLKTEEYDVILLDIQMPGQDGFDLVSTIRSQKIYTPIIMISGKEEEHNKIIALGLGADDYLTKPFSILLLSSKVKAILRRNGVYRQETTNMLHVGPFTIDQSKMVIKKDGAVLDLTPREFKLLMLFMNHPNQVFTKEQLYEKVWNENVVDDNTIMVYIKRLRKKIEENPKEPLWIKTVWGIGYQFFVE